MKEVRKRRKFGKGNPWREVARARREFSDGNIWRWKSGVIRGYRRGDQWCECVPEGKCRSDHRWQWPFRWRRHTTRGQSVEDFVQLWSIHRFVSPAELCNIPDGIRDRWPMGSCRSISVCNGNLDYIVVATLKRMLPSEHLVDCWVGAIVRYAKRESTS